MKNFKTVILFLIVATFTVSSVYASESCSSVIENLKQMKKAQLTVQSSLIGNHDMMADSLESYADAIKSSQGKAHKTVSSSMQSASVSLRKRGQKAQELANKLAEQTDELIKLVENCIK